MENHLYIKIKPYLIEEGGVNKMDKSEIAKDSWAKRREAFPLTNGIHPVSRINIALKLSKNLSEEEVKKLEELKEKAIVKYGEPKTQNKGMKVEDLITKLEEDLE